MSEWKEYKLSELCELIGGGTPKTANLEYWNGNIPWLSVTDFNTGRKYCYDAEKKITEKGLNESSTKILKKGQIIISARGTVGVISMLGKDMAFNQSNYGINAKVGLTSNDFLYYLLKDNISQFISNSYGAVFDTITKQTFEQITVELPSLPEQTAIAEILSSLDDKIDLLHRQNKTLEQLAETLFRKWFVPARAGEPHAGGEEADESWEEKSLDEIAEYLNGLALQKYPAVGNDYLPVIKIREMKQGISENTDKCSKAIPEKYIIHDGDVLFSWSGSLDIVIWPGGEGALNQHLFKVSSDEYPKWFYYLATKCHLENFRMIAETKSTTMGHIKREHLSEATIQIPPEKIFDMYDTRIAPLIDKQIKNNKQIKTLIQVRDTLLPKLIRGEVRVKI